MSKPNHVAEQIGPQEPVSEITLRLHVGPAMSAGELMQFDLLARSRGRTREQLMIDLIREEIAAAVAVPTAA